MFWWSILFQPNLANLQPVAALISTVGKPLSCGPQTTFTVNHKLQSNFMRSSKDLWKWPCIISGSGMKSGLDVIRCSALSDKITNWPKTTRKTEICKYLFYMNEDLYLIRLVWIIMFNSKYNHGVGKNWFKNLEYSLWITLSIVILSTYPHQGQSGQTSQICQY